MTRHHIHELRLGGEACNPLIEQLIRAILDQIFRQPLQQLSLPADQAQLPECLKNLCRMGGREFRRGMLDVEQK